MTKNQEYKETLVGFHRFENLLCLSESFLSITLYLFTLTGPELFCHAHATVTVVLVMPTTFMLTTSIRAVKTPQIYCKSNYVHNKLQHVVVPIINT